LLIVEAGVYNLDFWYLKKIEVGNVEIKASCNFLSIREQLRRQRFEHLKTGTAIVNVPENIEAEEAIDYAINELKDYEVLLSFAQKRHVFFHPFECFEVKDGVKRSLSKVIHSFRTGKPRGGIIVWQRGLEDFLRTGIPILRNADYNRKTGIKRAILFYNEACIMHPSVVEVMHPMLFAALELLSNAHLRNNPKSFLFSNKTWKEVTRKIRDALNQLSVDSNSINRILGYLGFAKHGSAKERIMYLLESNGFPTYESDLSQINDLRNDILHGRELRVDYDGENPIDVMLKCERLLAKLILKLLDFYHRDDVIHSAFLNEDLKARS